MSHPPVGEEGNEFGAKSSRQDLDHDKENWTSGCAYFLTILSICVLVVFFPFSMFFSTKVCQEYERAVIFRLGCLLSGKEKGPGIFWIIPCIDSYTKIDLRVVSFSVPPQEILSKDSVTVSVDAVVYFRISDPVVSITNVNDAAYSTKLLAQTTLRNILGTMDLSEMLSKREEISGSIQAVLDIATKAWGVQVERVEVKDIRLPQQLMRAMAAEAEASRAARAKVVVAEGEFKASRALREAAQIMAQSPAALQVRYLQTLNGIAAEHNNTIVLPLPVDIITRLLGCESSFNKGRPLPSEELPAPPPSFFAAHPAERGELMAHPTRAHHTAHPTSGQYAIHSQEQPQMLSRAHHTAHPTSGQYAIHNQEQPQMLSQAHQAPTQVDQGEQPAHHIPQQQPAHQISQPAHQIAQSAHHTATSPHDHSSPAVAAGVGVQQQQTVTTGECSITHYQQRSILRQTERDHML